MSPPRTLDPCGSSSGGICPNMASSSSIPLGAGPEGLGPSLDHVLVESCYEDPVPEPSDNHDSEHWRHKKGKYSTPYSIPVQVGPVASGLGPSAKTTTVDH
ncbi:hypothetical protein Peur_015635 [Populus x canadensis]